MGKYDRQLIIQVGEDSIVRNAAWSLRHKHDFKALKSIIVKLPANPGPNAHQGIQAELIQLTGESRLYIIGHGDSVQMKLEGWTGDQLGDALADAGLPKVKRISLISCGAGASGGWSKDDWPGSFAEVLCVKLAMKNVQFDLYARCYDMAVESIIRGNNLLLNGITVRKFTFSDPFDNTGQQKRPKSKVRYTNDGNKVVRSWVMYNGKDANTFEDF